MFDRAMKSILLAGVAGSGLIVSVPAFAQDAGESAGDIIVTARRTEERLQDVPISITVYNQDQLQKRNVAVASDLATYTPSLSVNTRFGPEKATFAIRGFNQDAGDIFADVFGDDLQAFKRQILAHEADVAGADVGHVFHDAATAEDLHFQVFPPAAVAHDAVDQVFHGVVAVAGGERRF